jgi:hypothetical protein
VPEVNDTMKSDWRLEVKVDQRKLGWCVECTVGPNYCLGRRKNMAESMR